MSRNILEEVPMGPGHYPLPSRRMDPEARPWLLRLRLEASAPRCVAKQRYQELGPGRISVP